MVVEWPNGIQMFLAMNRCTYIRSFGSSTKGHHFESFVYLAQFYTRCPSWCNPPMYMDLGKALASQVKHSSGIKPMSPTWKAEACPTTLSVSKPNKWFQFHNPDLTFVVQWGMSAAHDSKQGNKIKKILANVLKIIYWMIIKNTILNVKKSYN